jgi:5'-nucleotidase
MRILITNDDGAGAHGLTVLHAIARELSDDIWIVAPEMNQSGASHALTLQVPLRYREIGERAFAVRGTPADCVIMGVRHVLKDKAPDLILSGINHGANLAEDVAYSGTIAGAMEGTLIGIRSIAMSLTLGFDKEGLQHWKTPMTYGPEIVERLMAQDWPQGVLMNVNYPDLAPDAVSEIRLTRQGRRDQGLDIEARRDPWGMLISGSPSTAANPIRPKAPTCAPSPMAPSPSRPCRWISPTTAYAKNSPPTFPIPSAPQSR